MSDDVLSEEIPVTRGRAKRVVVDPSVKPEHITWVRDFVEAGKASEKNAEQTQKRGEIIGTEMSRVEIGRDGLAGLDFKMLVKVDATFKAKALALVGKRQEMSSLTGTGEAMKEIDTEHDLHKLEAIDPEVLKKAGESLQMVAEASQQVEKKLMLLYAEEAGIDPKDFEELQKKLEKKRAKEKDPLERSKKKNGLAKEEEDDPKLQKYEELRGKVDKEVRDEVWQPLVRQGLLPENFVPDRHSEVSRTFEAASELYQERLAKYTEDMGDNADLIAKLGVAKDIVDKTLKLGEALSGVPGVGDVASHIQTGFECAEILNSAIFDVAGQIVQKKDALDIANTVASGIHSILAKTGVVPEEVQTAIAGGMSIALTGGRSIKALMDGNPQDALNALASGLSQSLNLAGTVSGNPDMALAAKAAVPLITGGAKAAIFIKVATTKPVDKAAMKKALGDVVKEALTEVGATITQIVEAEKAKGNIGKDDGKLIEQGIGIGVGALSDLTDAMLSDDKVAGLATMLGNLAGSCCSTYLPPEYGSTLGAALKAVLGKGGQGLVKALKAKDPVKALSSVLTDIVSTALTSASQVKGLPPDIAQALQASAVATGQVAAIADFAKAVQAGDVNKAQASLQGIIDAVMAPVYAKVDPEAVANGTGDDSDGDDSGDDSGDDTDADDEDPLAGESKMAQQAEQEFNDKRRKLILAQNAIINKPGAKPADIEKAKKIRDQAVQEILERTAAQEEIEADAKEFAALLNGDLAGEDDGDTRTLEKLIKTIQRDRKVMQMADSMIGMGITVAAHFIAPLGIVSDFKKFAMEAAKAVAHLRELLIWKRNAAEARNAVTVQVHSMLNRVGLEEDMVIEHQMKATLALISALGNVIATAGAHAAPVGVAMTAASKVASAALEVALTIKSAGEMEMAWREFQGAMKNPKDRKKVRMAIQKNSTLAKYALVWGALQDGNPIARKALKRCGLTEPIIAKEGANVTNVIEYLEVLYNDDPVVLRATPDMTGWGWEAPKPLATLRCWTEFLATAQTAGKPKMMPGTGGAITAAFGALDPANKALAKAKTAQTRVERFIQAQATATLTATVSTDPTDRKAKPKADDDRRRQLLEAKLEAVNKVVAEKQKDLADAYRGIITAAQGFKPQDKDGNPYLRIVEWLDGLAAVAEIEIRKLDGEEVALELDDAA